jgi:hypothetical protein
VGRVRELPWPKKEQSPVTQALLSLSGRFSAASWDRDQLPVLVLAPVVAAELEPPPAPVVAAELDAELEAELDAELDAELEAELDAELEAELDAELEAELDAELELVPPFPPLQKPTPPVSMRLLSHVPAPQSVSSQQYFAQVSTQVRPPMQNLLLLQG